MTEPTEVDIGETFIVTDKNSPHSGTKGSVMEVYDEKVTLSLYVHFTAGNVVKEFEWRQVERV